MEEIRSLGAIGPDPQDLGLIYRIGKQQRFVLQVFLFSALLRVGVFAGQANLSPTDSGSLAVITLGFVTIALAFVFMVGIYRLAAALGHTGLVYVLEMFVPLLNLLILLRLIGQANRKLKSAGISVGLLGASAGALEELRTT